MASERQEKITAALGSQLGDRPDEMVDVIVELSPDPGGEPASAPAMKESFEKAAQPVNEAISRTGGEVLGAVWLNRTLRAKVPAAKVPELTGLDEIAALDAPRQITPE